MQRGGKHRRHSFKGRRLHQLLQRVRGLRLVLDHRAQLLSKDALVLRLARRLLPLGVVVVVGPLGSAKAPSLPVSAD